MSQVEETLGGLRIIKAFCAEEKMNKRFDKVNSDYRNSVKKGCNSPTNGSPNERIHGHSDDSCGALVWWNARIKLRLD